MMIYDKQTGAVRIIKDNSKVAFTAYIPPHETRADLILQIASEGRTLSIGINKMDAHALVIGLQKMIEEI